MRISETRCDPWARHAPQSMVPSMLRPVTIRDPNGPVPMTPAPPHPPLVNYYSRAEDRPAFVRALFDRTSTHYDRINTIFSLGSGVRFRRQMLLRAGLRPGMRMLDVAIGTGLVAREAVSIIGSESVIGLDISSGMLREARRALSIPLIQGDAQTLPIGDGSMDFLTMGYALRHVSDLGTTFREFLRVLKPGGRALVLEIGRPRHPAALALARAYLGHVVPFLTRWTTSAEETRTLMRYYWDTIEQCAAPEEILHQLQTSGFSDAQCRTDYGMFRAYLATKLEG